ncbi:hypothetical protein F1654_03215 [Alkalicaulis satelles]|uniref:Uncharacterized protein n=1 Tax=Alkalicaulis satelles TaxID=2609175 RepID=A0A5M6ZL28_9PROT|nr:hypothetical protein [Alkalicaulis satelles]KAA5805020.1 hypothetical protein F1654_03215 [Alkalicaulis satelles]
MRILLVILGVIASIGAAGDLLVSLHVHLFMEGRQLSVAGYLADVSSGLEWIRQAIILVAGEEFTAPFMQYPAAWYFPVRAGLALVIAILLFAAARAMEQKTETR